MAEGSGASAYEVNISRGDLAAGRRVLGPGVAFSSSSDSFRIASALSTMISLWVIIRLMERSSSSTSAAWQEQPSKTKTCTSPCLAFRAARSLSVWSRARKRSGPTSTTMGAATGMPDSGCATALAMGMEG